MTASVEKQKAKVHFAIQRSSDRHDLQSMFDSIDLADLQSMLCDYVTNQMSPEKVAKLYYGSQSVLDIVGPDCTRHALSFLGYQEMCRSRGVCKAFSDWLSSMKHAPLLVNPDFIEFLFGDWSGSFVIGYNLQHEYEDSDLNQFSFEEMGTRGMLREKDMEIWTICHHFGFETKLIPWLIDHGPILPKVMCYNGPFGRRYSPSESPQWNVLKGTYHLDINYHSPSCYLQRFAAVQIKCRGRLWRNNFVSRNLSGNCFEMLLSVHPLFAEYRKWNGSGDYLIGYSPLNDESASLGIRYESFAKLGRRGELRGIDMIICRLCEHFGFEMKSFLMIDDGDGVEQNGYVMEWNKITADQFENAGIEWKDSDWYLPSWNKVWDHQLPKMNGIEVLVSYEIYTGRPVLQIRCRKLSRDQN